jgi:homoserine dehydrogenase
LRIAVLGLGTVGRQVVEVLDLERELFASRLGEEIEVARILVHDQDKPRPESMRSRLTYDPDDILKDPDIEVVVEVMGGFEPAHSYIAEAIRRGKAVVTANKEVIARSGPDLSAAGERAGADLLFEAAVAGGIPIIRSLQESLAGNRLRAIYGIVNGTTNFILSRMHEDGVSFDAALLEAKQRGYAEADPSDDLDAVDAARKISILASLAFGGWVDVDNVDRIGIRSITAADVREAKSFGAVIKLVARAEATPDGLALGVSPTLISRSHPLADVSGAQNAVYVRGEPIGELLFEGPGAGGPATSSAVIGDILDAARARRVGGRSVALPLEPAPLLPLLAHQHSYYLRLRVSEEAGSLAAVAHAFSRAGISLRSVHQPPSGDAEAMVSLVTRATAREQLERAREILRAEPAVLSEESCILAEMDRNSEGR